MNTLCIVIPAIIVVVVVAMMLIGNWIARKWFGDGRPRF